MALGSTLRNCYDALDRFLRENEFAEAFVEKTRIPPKLAAPVAIGLGAVIAVVLVVDLYGNLVSGALCWLYPSIATFRLLLSHIDYARAKKMDAAGTLPPPPGEAAMLHWLRFWLLYGAFLAVYDPLLGKHLRAIIPFYQLARTVLFFSLAVPQTSLLERFMDWILPLKRNVIRDILLHGRKHLAAAAANDEKPVASAAANAAIDAIDAAIDASSGPTDALSHQVNSSSNNNNNNSPEQSLAMDAGLGEPTMEAGEEVTQE